MLWSPDSRSWVATWPTTPGPFLDIFLPSQSLARRVPLPLKWKGADVLDLNHADVLGFNRAGNVILASEQRRFRFPAGGKRIQLTEFKIGKTLEIVRSWSVAMPTSKPVEDGYLSMSPDGERLVWCLSDPIRPPIGIRIGRFGLYPNSGRSRAHHLWSSNVDGTQLHDLGSVTDVYDRRNTALFEGPPQWLPDRREISFVYEGTLWKLPVP